MQHSQVLFQKLKSMISIKMEQRSNQLLRMKNAIDLILAKITLTSDKTDLKTKILANMFYWKDQYEEPNMEFVTTWN